MVTIVPGYDFGVNEIPRADTLRRQAANITISGLTVADLEVGIRSILAGDDSEATESIRFGDPVGRVWISPLGDLWVQEQSGPVILHRVEGGFQTRRYAVKIDTDEPSSNKPGHPVRSNNAWPGNYEDYYRTESGHSTFSDATYWMMSETPTYEDNRTGLLMGVLDTDTSGSEHVRVNIRGLTIFYDQDDVQSVTRTTLNRMRRGVAMYRPGGITGGETFHKQDLLQTLANEAYRFFGWVGVKGPDRANETNCPDCLWSLEWVGHQQTGAIYMNKNT